MKIVDMNTDEVFEIEEDFDIAPHEKLSSNKLKRKWISQYSESSTKSTSSKKKKRGRPKKNSPSPPPFGRSNPTSTVSSEIPSNVLETTQTVLNTSYESGTSPVPPSSPTLSSNPPANSSEKFLDNAVTSTPQNTGNFAITNEQSPRLPPREEVEDSSTSIEETKNETPIETKIETKREETPSEIQKENELGKDEVPLIFTIKFLNDVEANQGKDEKPDTPPESLPFQTKNTGSIEETPPSSDHEQLQSEWRKKYMRKRRTSLGSSEEKKVDSSSSSPSSSPIKFSLKRDEIETNKKSDSSSTSESEKKKKRTRKRKKEDSNSPSTLHPNGIAKLLSKYGTDHMKKIRKTMNSQSSLDDVIATDGRTLTWTEWRRQGAKSYGQVLAERLKKVDRRAPVN